MRNAAAARRAAATGAPALRSAACFPRASGARALGPLPCARRTSLSSAHARPSHCGVRGNSSSWRSPPSTMLCSLVRSLHSCRDRHHKNALCHGWNGLPYSRAGVPAEWSWKRPPTVRTPPCPLASQKIRPASQSRCHPVRSLAEPSPRDLTSGDTRRRRHHSSSVMPLGVERSSQPNAVTPGCGRGLSYCNRDNSRSSMTHAAPAASVLFRLGMLVLMPVKIHPGWLRPIGFCYGES